MPTINYSYSSTGFGEHFKKSVRTLYAFGNSSVKMPCGATVRIDWGICQRCPASPMQIIATHIKKSKLKGISVAGKVISLSPLADDATLFLQDKSQIDIAVRLLDVFLAA